ncbi:zinc finger protein SNAI2-like [Daktulosphaira vitifoliae]|uniref:zinc finger protein SNAI2-like n=1 Tax=Daktulosphaira vitifoliae TaxID=58002 RepID=UPI0021AA2F14|nr:zinc finger protein SNAI2-like [Daktulosphaira vitifoliae]
MHIWDDKPMMHHKAVAKKMDYSHCPLKKRPVHYDRYVKEEMDYETIAEADYSEPENLSTKPQDLSIKCKQSTAVPLAPQGLKKESLYMHQLPVQPSPYHHPYQPTAIKPGPLEPLCLNIAAGGDHPGGSYPHNHGPTAPRPVPAQYPPAAYHLGYMYHGLSTEPRAYPVYPPPPTSIPLHGRDGSLSPPGSSYSAFKPHVPSWQSRSSDGGWSPPALTETSSPAVSPYGGGGHSGESDTASSITNVSTITSNSTTTQSIKTGGRYKCTTCSKTYSTVSGLTKHQQFHCSDDECGGSPKTFSCKYCEKAYNTLGALKMHIRTHTLPCICKLCGKAFSRPWLLQGHIRTHTGEKPFSCPHCNRAFADRSNLRAHLQTHSDVKKYSCPTCSKTFSRMSLLTKHCDTGCPRLSDGHRHLQNASPQ